VSKEMLLRPPNEHYARFFRILYPHLPQPPWLVYGSFYHIYS
jgi:hypothetical protein